MPDISFGKQRRPSNVSQTHGSTTSRPAAARTSGSFGMGGQATASAMPALHEMFASDTWRASRPAAIEQAA